MGPPAIDSSAIGAPPIPECPRCGYNQSGPIATWGGSCPLEGTCSECGLVFAWGDVLSPRVGPKWSFEHAPRPSARRWLTTAPRALAPSILWQRLLLHHTIVPARLALFVVVTLGLSHVAAILAHLWLGGGRYLFELQEGPASAIIALLLWPYGGPLEIYYNHFPLFMTPFLLSTYLPAAFMPLSMLVLGQTFRSRRVRRRHLLRALAYSVALSTAGMWILTAAFYAGFLRAPGSVLGPGGPLWGVLVPIAILAVLIWFGAWWWYFISRYLRLPHALGITIMMAIVSALASAVLVALISLALKPA